MLSNLGIPGGYFDALLKMNAAYEEACKAMGSAVLAGLNNLRAAADARAGGGSSPPAARAGQKQESRRSAGFPVLPRSGSAHQRVTTTLVELALLAASRATTWIVWLPAPALRVFQL